MATNEKLAGAGGAAKKLVQTLIIPAFLLTSVPQSPAFAQAGAVADGGEACYLAKQFPIGRYGEVVLDRPQSILGESSEFGNAEPMGNFASEDSLRAAANPVGRLDIALTNGCMVTCTATLLSDGLIITARHCLRPTSLTIVKAQIVFDHYTTGDSAKPMVAVDLASIRTFQSINDTNNVPTYPDVAVAKLMSVPARPTATLYPNLPGDQTSLSIIHHPHGAPKYITRGFCRVVNNNGVMITHLCDTEGGSSGAPMLDQSTGQIIGIHTNGKINSSDVNANRGFAIGALAPQLRAAYGEKFFATPEQAVAVQRIVPDTQVEIDLANRNDGRTSDIITAEGHYLAGRYREALGPLLMLAGQSNAVAQFYLGNMYARGLEVARDEVNAVEYYRKAWENGNLDALLSLGNAYYAGLGIPQNSSEAFYLYRRLADSGRPDGMTMVARLYHDGKGVTKDRQEALRWWRKAVSLNYLPAISDLLWTLPLKMDDPLVAAEYVALLERGVAVGGDERMQAQLGYHLATGKDPFVQNVPRALQLLLPLAANRNPQALNTLGKIYRDGLGDVVADPSRAERYFRDARANGSQDALGNLIALLAAKPATDRAELYQLYLAASVDGAWSAIGHIGLAGFYERGEIVPKSSAQAFYHAIIGINEGIFHGTNLTDVWMVMRRSRADLSYAQRQDVVKRLCDEKKGIPVVDCDANPAVLSNITNSEQPPSLQLTSSEIDVTFDGQNP